MVRDGDAMGIAPEILQYMLGTRERWFGVDHPVFAEQRSQPGGKDLGLRQRSESVRKAQVCAGKRTADRPRTYREKPGAALGWAERSEPGMESSGVIERQPTGGNHTMDMRVKWGF